MNKQSPWPPLNQRKQFDKGFDTGRRQHGKHFMLIHWADDSPCLGMIVSRKVDARAVARNRIKRVVREVVRQHPWPRPCLIRLIVLAKHSASQTDNDGLRSELTRLIQRAIQHHEHLPNPAEQDS